MQCGSIYYSYHNLAPTAKEIWRVATKPYLVSCTFYRRGFYRRGYGSDLQISKCDVKHYSDVLMPFQPIGLRQGATAADSCDNTNTVQNMEASSALVGLY